MDQKLHHTSIVAQSQNAEEPHLLIRQNLLEEQFAAEIELVRKIALQPVGSSGKPFWTLLAGKSWKKQL